MENAPTQIELGSVETLLGNLQFTFVISPEGDAHIQVYAVDPSSSVKSGIVVMLDAQRYERLREIVRSADATIDRMIGEGRIKRMVLPY